MALFHGQDGAVNPEKTRRVLTWTTWTTTRPKETGNTRTEPSPTLEKFDNEGGMPPIKW
jgi:hypothetical protein